MKKIVFFLKQISLIKTIYFNFKLFPLGQAVHFPLAIGKHTTVKIKRGDE